MVCPRFFFMTIPASDADGAAVQPALKLFSLRRSFSWTPEANAVKAVGTVAIPSSMAKRGGSGAWAS